VPIRLLGITASLELYRQGPPFSAAERTSADLAAGQAALALRAHRLPASAPTGRRTSLELAGEALAAALDDGDGADEVVRVAATVVGAPVGLIWEQQQQGALHLVGAYGIDSDTDLDTARALVESSLLAPGPVAPVTADGLP